MSKIEVYSVNMVPCCLSAISCSIFLFCYFRYEGVKLNPSMRLIAVLQFLDLILSLNTLFPSLLFPRNTVLCNIQGFNEQLFSTSEVIWTGWFSLSVYRKTCQNKPQNISIYKSILLTFSITFPLALLFLLLGFYKPSTYWCWVNSRSALVNFFVLEFLCSYFFVFLAAGWGVFVMYSVHKVVRGSSNIIDKDILRLQAYPVIMFFCYVFMFSVRALQAGDATIPVGYEQFSAVLINLVGFINFLVLGFTEEFRSGVRFVRGETVENFFYSSEESRDSLRVNKSLKA